VRDLAVACANEAEAFAPKVAEHAAAALDDEAPMGPSDQALLTTAILNRTLGQLR
jgi:hypothetical protein